MRFRKIAGMRTGCWPVLWAFLVFGGGCSGPEQVEERADGSVARGYLDHEGFRTGRWFEYRPDGSLHSRGEYRDGTLRELDVFDPEGAIVLIYRRTGDPVDPGHAFHAYRDGSRIATLRSEGESTGDIRALHRILQQVPSSHAKVEMLKSGSLDWRLLFEGLRRALGERAGNPGNGG